MNDQNLNTENTEETITTRSDITNDPLLGVQIVNGIGEMNSFINVNIHFLYDIKELSAFILNEDFPYEYKFNLLQELKLSFEKYYKLSSPIYYPKIPSRMRFIDIKELKYELNELYKENKQMKNKPIDDPMEVLFIFINSMHNYLLKMESLIQINEERCEPICLTHDILYNEIIEEVTCSSCGYKSELFQYDSNAYFYEIQLKNILNNNPNDSFEELYCKIMIKEKLFYSEPEIECPVKCNHPRVLRKRMLLKSSKYFLLSLVYETVKQREIDICKIFIMLPLLFSNKDLFTIYTNDNIKHYLINGIICKKGMNEYIYFKYNSTQEQAQELISNGNRDKPNTKDKSESYWVYYEDMKIMKLSQYKEVIEFSLKNVLTPILVLYKEYNKETNAEYLNSQQSKKDKTKPIFIDEFQLNPVNKADYDRYIHYCHSVEKDSILTYMNESNQASRLRPVNQLMKVSKKEIEKMINKLKAQVYEKRTNLSPGEDDDCYINQGELIKNLKGMLDEDGNEVNRAKEKEEENKSKWQCTKCYLYNIKNCYRCERCKYFDYQMYKTLLNNNSSHDEEKNKDDNEIINNKGQGIDYNGIILNERESKESLRKGGDNCWQCGHFNPFHCLKCKYCRFDIHQLPLVHIDTRTNYSNSLPIPNKKFKRVGLKREYYQEDIQEKHIAVQSHNWNCKFCNQQNKNTTNTLYCKFCFKNNSTKL